MAATTGGEAGDAGRVTGSMGRMEIDADGVLTDSDDGADENRGVGTAGEMGGTVDGCARACEADGEAGDLPGQTATARQTAGESDTTKDGAGGAAVDGAGSVEGGAMADARPCEQKVGGFRHKLLKEVWCLRSTTAYPKAAEAAAAVREGVVDAWGGLPQLKGFPLEVLVYEKTRSKEVQPAATGMVKVTRSSNDGWEVEGWSRLCALAWPLASGIDHCKWVKTFGSSSEHAREVNWLMNSTQKYLAAGGSLSMEPSLISFGYTELPPRVARLNGAEWSGCVYGTNLPLQDLMAVVDWGFRNDKETKASLKSELMVDPNRRGVISTSIAQGCPGYRFQPADFIAGSFTLLIESKLGLTDFDLEASEDAAGVELLCNIFGQHVVLDVTPSVGGLVGTGILRVKVKCGLRYEKEARALAHSLMLETSEADATRTFQLSDRSVDVTFYSEETARAAAELVESSKTAGRSNQGGGNTLKELEAVSQALAEIKEVQILSGERMMHLAEEQQRVVSSCTSKIEDLAKIQACATAESKERYESTQAQLSALAAGQAQAAQESRDNLAEVQRQAFAFAQTLHLQMLESVEGISARLLKERVHPTRKGLQVHIENVAPGRLVLTRKPARKQGVGTWACMTGSLGEGESFSSVGHGYFFLGAHSSSPFPSQWGGGSVGRWAPLALVWQWLGRRYVWAATLLWFALRLVLGKGVAAASARHGEGRRSVTESAGEGNRCEGRGSGAWVQKKLGAPGVSAGVSGRQGCIGGRVWFICLLVLPTQGVLRDGVWVNQSGWSGVRGQAEPAVSDLEGKGYAGWDLYRDGLGGGNASFGGDCKVSTSSGAALGRVETSAGTGVWPHSKGGTSLVSAWRWNVCQGCVDSDGGGTGWYSWEGLGRFCWEVSGRGGCSEGCTMGGMVAPANPLLSGGVQRCCERLSHEGDVGGTWSTLQEGGEAQAQRGWLVRGRIGGCAGDGSRLQSSGGREGTATCCWCSAGSDQSARLDSSGDVVCAGIAGFCHTLLVSAEMSTAGDGEGTWRCQGHFIGACDWERGATGGACTGRRDHYSLTQAAGCDQRFDAVDTESHRFAVTAGGLHTHGKSFMRGGESDGWSRRIRGIGRRELIVSRLGHANGSSCRRMSSAQRVESGHRVSRACNHGPSSPLRGGQEAPAVRLGLAQYSERRRMASHSVLHLSFLGYRCGCRRHGSHQWWEMEIHSGCGSGGVCPPGSRGGLGMEVRTRLRRCLQQRDQSRAVGRARASRFLLPELEMRTLVVSQHGASAERGTEGGVASRCRGDAGAGEGSDAGTPGGDFDRVRRRSASSQIPTTLGMGKRLSSPSERLGLVLEIVEFSRPGERCLAQKASVGYRHAEMRWSMTQFWSGIVRGLILWCGLRRSRTEGRSRFAWLGRNLLDSRSEQKGLAAGDARQGWLDGQCGSCEVAPGAGVGRSLAAGAAVGADGAAGIFGRSGEGVSRGNSATTVGSPNVRESRCVGDGSGAVASQTAAAAGCSSESVSTGLCLFWNARQLCAPLEKDRWGGGSEEDVRAARKACHAKLRLLSDRIDVLVPWLVAIVEVDSSPGRMRALRAWFRRRGYEMVHLPGEGSSRGGLGAANGVVLAAAKDVQVVESRRIGFRTLAVQAFHKPSRRALNVAVMHGASTDGGEDGAGGGWSFCNQLEAAVQWCELHEGALLMDANRVPCARWRSPSTGRLSKGDLLLRKISGWSCRCCPVAEEEAGSVGSLIGRQLQDSDGEAVWTRWGMLNEATHCRSRLDIGVAFGEASSLWTEAMVMPPDLAVSDHAMVEYRIRASPLPVVQGEARPMPVRLGPRPRADCKDREGSAWAVMSQLAGSEAFLDALREATVEAKASGSSATEKAVALFRSIGEEAVRRAAEARARGHRSHGTAMVFDNRSDKRVWEQRIELAQAIWKGSREMSFRDWQQMFHRKTGMHRFCPRFVTHAWRRVNWEKYICRCRRQWERAVAFMEHLNREKDRKLADICHRMEAAGTSCDSPAHINTLWKMIRERRGSDRMRRLHAGDTKGGRVLLPSDADFLEEAGRIGELFVRDMDRGCCSEMLRAWLRVFVDKRPSVAPREGWAIEKVFPFAAFLSVSRSMRGKAVGAGGMSVELLLASPREAQWLFYQAIMADASTGCFSSAWRRVLYVLLRKPAPNDPDIVAQRREIALMPQDLKVFLQGLRRASFSKIGRSLLPEQYGWKAGYGCSDPGMALSAVLQQARKLHHPVFVLYIDLANFFPAINRHAASVCEEWAGLPVQVADVMASVYGSDRKPDDAVRCQYETEAGLGREFRNHVGRLMGCPLSPDSAKILLDSILSAIKRSVTGVALWPFEGAEVLQVAYADDWTGVFDDVLQLRKAWSLWTIWAEMIGARLGIKGFFKSVVSGSQWDGERCLPMPDPGLRNLDGTRVPFAAPERLYKHLGVPRACNADGRLTWVGGDGVLGIRDKLRACIGRIRKLRRHSTSAEQFMCISNVLLGGMAGVYLQTAYASFEETEEIERAWRKTFCRFAKRDFAAPAAELYAPQEGWGAGRTHIYAVGQAALFAAVEKAMADPCPSPSREAVRSAVALSLFQWGCRSDPHKWDWSHLDAALQKGLRGRGIRGIGDAWMLAVREMEGRRDPLVSTAVRDEEMRVARWGRWRGLRGDDMRSDGAESNPLRESSPFFATESTLLFEPVERGGLGLPLQPALLEIGVAEVHDMSGSPWRGSSRAGRWLENREQVQLKVGRMSAAIWKAWTATLAALKDAGIEPAAPRESTGLVLRYHSHRRTGSDQECQNRILSAVRSAKGGLSVVPQEVWEARLRKGFCPRATAAACNGESLHSPEPIIGMRLEKDGCEDFMHRGELERSSFPASRHGDWGRRRLDLLNSVFFSPSDGWPRASPSSLGDLSEEAVGALPPALQLAVRARTRLGKEASVLEAGWGCKVPGWRVALDAQRRSWETLCELQARLDFDFAFAVDASTSVHVDERGFPVRDVWGWPQKRTAAVAVGHDGRVHGGVLDPELPSDNYMGELRALIVALSAVPEDSSVLLVLDATSPVRAWRRFRSRCTRGKWKYHEAPMLDSLEQLIRRKRLVYFYWQSSHCGAPVNEVADVEAEKIRTEKEAVLLKDDDYSPLFTMWPARPSGALFAWAKLAMSQGLDGRIGSVESRSLPPLEGDWGLGVWEEDQGAMLHSMRRETLMAGDRGHRDDCFGERASARACCPLGCETGCSSWVHYAFECEHGDLREHRARWRERIILLRPLFDGLMLHKQVEAVLQLIRCHGQAPVHVGMEPPLLLARRFMAGMVEKTIKGDGVKEDRALAAVREAVEGGLVLLGRAIELEKEVRLDATRRILDNRAVGKSLRKWRSRCECLGPRRSAFLLQIRFWRNLAAKVMAARLGEGSMSVQEVRLVSLRLGDLFTSAHAVARQTEELCKKDVGLAWCCAWMWFKKVLAGPKSRWRVSPLCPALAEAGEIVSGLWPATGEWFLGRKRRTILLRSQWAGSGRPFCVRVTLPGLRDRMLGALRRWLRAGGVPLIRRYVRRRAAAAAAERRKTRAKELAVARESLDNFCHGKACSGAEIPRVAEEERIELVLQPRTKRRRASDEWQRGLRADKRGRWAVESIIMVRGLEPEERGWKALVDWKGPFAPSWVRSQDLCGPARLEALALVRELYAVESGWPELELWIEEVSETQGPVVQERVGWRRSPRLLEAERRREGSTVDLGNSTRLGSEGSGRSEEVVATRGSGGGDCGCGGSQDVPCADLDSGC